MSIIKDKYIFIHNPRTGGSSIEADIGGSSHETIYGYSQDNIDIDKYFKCMFVRNPYTRLVSAYESANLKTLPTELHNLFSSFTIFIENLPKLFDYTLINYKETRAMYGVFDQSAPQYYFGCINNTLNIDFIGRFEKRDADLKAMSELCNIKTPKKHINKVTYSKPKTREYFTDETLSIVNDLHERDFDLFGYTKIYCVKNMDF